MQLRHLPRSKSGTKYHAPNPGRPVPMNDMPMRQEAEPRFFPDGAERVPSCNADYSIPTLDQIIQKVGNKSSSQLIQLLENQTVLEKLAWAETDSSDESLSHAQESETPPVCHEFQAARLFLAHFGLLSIEAHQPHEQSEIISSVPLLTVLDATRFGFSNDLHTLDKLSPRLNDTLHIFYVKVGQTNAAEIVDNMSSENLNSVSKDFWNVLLNLGWPVEIDEHAGWTGSVNTSWKTRTNHVMSPKKDFNLNSPDDMKFNGEERVLYWADVGAEIAFVVPTKWNKCDDSSDGACLSMQSTSSSESEKPHLNYYDRSNSETQQPKILISEKPRTLSLELDKPRTHSSLSSGPGSTDPIPPSRRRTGALKPTLMGQIGAKMLFVWLESFEDYLTFPTGNSNFIHFLQYFDFNFNYLLFLDDILSYTKTGEEGQLGQMLRASDCYIIFIHALNSGLLRIKLQGPTGRMNFATPLIDGMVASKRVVGTLIRQTVYNMSKRRRLDNDLYVFQPK